MKMEEDDKRVVEGERKMTDLHRRPCVSVSTSAPLSLPLATAAFATLFVITMSAAFTPGQAIEAYMIHLSSLYSYS